MEVGMGRAACQGLSLSCPYNVRGDTLPRWGCVILANTLHFRPCNTGTERKVNPGACGVEHGGPCGTWRRRVSRTSTPCSLRSPPPSSTLSQMPFTVNTPFTVMTSPGEGNVARKALFAVFWLHEQRPECIVFFVKVN